MAADVSTSDPPGRLGHEIRPRSLREEIAAVLERAILTGRFEPGQRLVERELVAEFGVSSIPIREALQELESRGLVVRRHNHGCSVVQLSHQEAAKIAALRRALEPHVVAWAANHMTPARAEALRAQLDRVARAADADDVPSFFHEDMIFHKMMWEFSENRYAARALETGIGSLFASGLIRGTRAETLDLRAEVAKHELLLKELSKGNGQNAALLLLDIAEGFEKQV